MEAKLPLKNTIISSTYIVRDVMVWSLAALINWIFLKEATLERAMLKTSLAR